MKKTTLFITSIILISQGCKKNNPEPLVNFTADWDQSGATIPDDFPIEMGIEPGPSTDTLIYECIQIQSDTVRNGENALKLTVKEQFTTQGGAKNRLEVNYKHDNVENSEVWYAWSFLIPENFVELDKNLYPNSWNIIAQFHAIPDPENGMPSAEGTNPPVALYAGVDEETGNFGCELRYGIMNENVGPIGNFQITKGQWVDMKLHIKWSQKKNKGWIEAWANGIQITDGRVEGQNMHNSQPHYFKFGFYRGAGMPYDNTIYLDELRVSSTESGVAIQ